MGLTVTQIERVFKLTHEGEEIVLDDPNPSLTPNEVLKLLSGTYPSINNSNIIGPVIENDKSVYEFTNNIGTKG